MATFRNPYFQPFAEDSIWNTPIGSGATYSPANLEANPGGGSFTPMPSLERVHIVMTPTAPVTVLNQSTVAWNSGNRCAATGGQLGTVRMPATYTVQDTHDSLGHQNDCAAWLAADLRTIQEAQPLARCTASQSGTVLQFAPPGNQDFYGQGVGGSHGGSDLSSIGGSIRVGELRPSGALDPYTHGPTHVLSGNLYGGRYFFRSTTASQLYRYPATVADGYGTQTSPPGYGTVSGATNVTNSQMVMGVLLAIPPSIDITTIGLLSDPGKQLAWTLQNYGMYIADDTAGDGYALAVEDGCNADGSQRRKETEFFNDFGLLMFDRWNHLNTNAWVHDYSLLMTKLSAVTNNTSTTKGGGGVPLQLLADDFSGTFKTEAHAFNNTASALTINVPASTVNGDFLIASIGYTGNLNITAPAGWTHVRSTGTGVTSTDASLSVYWRNANSEPANYVWNFDASGALNGFIWRINNINPNNPISVSGFSNGAGTTISSSGLTTLVNNTLLLNLTTKVLASSAAWTPPFGWSNHSNTTASATIQTMGFEASLYDQVAYPGIMISTDGISTDKWTNQFIALAPNTGAPSSNDLIDGKSSTILPGSTSYKLTLDL